MLLVKKGFLKMTKKGRCQHIVGISLNEKKDFGMSIT